MTIRYFAHARKLTGCAEEHVEPAAPLSSGELWTLILSRHPRLAVLRDSSRLARNQEFADAGTIFQPGDEIAVIPPVSGG